MYKRKFKKGDLITSLDELAKQEFIVTHYGNKVVHCGWFMSWQFRMAKNLVDDMGGGFIQE